MAAVIVLHRRGEPVVLVLGQPPCCSPDRPCQLPSRRGVPGPHELRSMYASSVEVVEFGRSYFNRL